MNKYNNNYEYRNNLTNTDYNIFNLINKPFVNNELSTSSVPFKYNNSFSDYKPIGYINSDLKDKFINNTLKIYYNGSIKIIKPNPEI